MAYKTKLRWLDGGSAQIELAFSILFMLVAVLTLMELGNAIYTYVVLSDAANEGVRFAIVNSKDASFATDVTNKVTNYASAAFTLGSTSNIKNCGPNSNLNFVNVTCPDSGGSCPGSVPGRVEVTVCYPYVPLIGLTSKISSTSPTMTAYAEGRLVY